MRKRRPRIRRLFAVYEKESDKFVRDYELKKFNLSEVQKVFNQNDHMDYCYKITEKEAPYFRQTYRLRFHFKKREYFLETVED